MKSKDRGLLLSFLIVAALLLAGCPDLNKNGDSPAVAGLTQTDIAFSGNKLEITFDKELKSFDASQITITLDDNAITEDKTNDYTLSIDGTKLVITFKTNPSTGQKYKVSLKAGAVTGKDGGTFKKKDSVEIPFVVPPAYTKGSITQNNNKIELRFSKDLATTANVSPNPTHIKVTRTRSEGASETLTISTDYTLGISGSKLVITLIKPPIAGVYTVALRASAVKSADGGLSMAVKPDPTIKILNPPKKEQPRTEQPEEEPKPKELSRQLIKEQPEVTPSPAYTKESITQNNNKIELSFSKALATTANVSPNPTHITVTRVGKALVNKTDYSLSIDGKKLVITLKLKTPPNIAGVYTVALRASAVKSADGVLSMAVKPDPTIEILSSNELSRQLLHAVYINDAKEVATLIAAGADVNVKSDKGDTPLYLAARQEQFSVNQVNKLKIVQALIDADADVNFKDKNGKTPLHWAADLGHTTTAQALIDADADVNVKDENGKTPLHWAAIEDYTEIVQALIDADADVKVKDKDDKTLLHLVASKGHTATVKALIDAKVDVNIKDRYEKTPLHWAAFWGHTATVKALIDAKADVNIKDKDGKNPLYLAAFRSHTATVKALIDAKADVNIKDRPGNTPLHWAAYNGHTATLQALIDAKADLSTKDRFGNTPLHVAADKDHTSTVQALIDAKADLNAKNKHRRKTPLHLAAEKGHTSTVQALINAKADLNAKNSFGTTPLYMAVRNGKTATVQALINAKADLNAKDRFGNTPLKVAKRYKQTDIVQLLEAAGAKV